MAVRPRPKGRTKSDSVPDANELGSQDGLSLGITPSQSARRSGPSTGRVSRATVSHGRLHSDR